MLVESSKCLRYVKIRLFVWEDLQVFIERVMEISKCFLRAPLLENLILINPRYQVSRESLNRVQQMFRTVYRHCPVEVSIFGRTFS